MKKLPIGIQTFSEIRDAIENFVYIDKTAIALTLIQRGKYYFLSRPRRFGKSLFLDTLRNIFEGNIELFEGLYIYDKYDWSQKYPVIEISFGTGGVRSKSDLERKIKKVLQRNQKWLDVQCDSDVYDNDYFSEFIENTHKKYKKKVVILVDEYDKPILDNITNEEVAKEIRNRLRDFYSVIKDSDRYIKFVFLAGVSKFSRVSLFSGLNNLEDITFNSRYSSICGYTQEDLEREFSEYLPSCDLEKIKKWYNGYNWLGESVYNPFDILLFFSNDGLFKSYWFETGTPTFLIDLIRKRRFFVPSLANIEQPESFFGKFDVDQINLETLLLQTGYLTIERAVTIDGICYFRLMYPNLEVRSALNYAILDFFIPDQPRVQTGINRVLEISDLEGIKNQFVTLFASIPYNNFTKSRIHEYEGYYSSVVYSFLASRGLDLIAEDITNTGRIDLTVKVKSDNNQNLKIYIFEFKVIDDIPDQNSAMKQLKEKKYQQKYLSLDPSTEIYLIGIEFSKQERNLATYEWERVG